MVTAITGWGETGSIVSRRRKFTPEVIVTLCRLADEGKSSNAIADQLHSTPLMVRKMAHAHGVVLSNSASAHLSTDVTPDVAEKLQMVASSMDIGPSTLLNNLVTVIVNDDLFNAVLDTEDKDAT